MKSQILLFLLFSILSPQLFAGDVYAEYKMTGVGDKSFTTKLYIKNGNRKSEVNMNVGGKEIITTTLFLTSNPDVSIVFNSQAKTYTESKKGTDHSDIKDLTITVLGNEKIGIYNCTHVRMASDNKSWDMWLTKDIANFDFSMDENDASNLKMRELLKNKNVDGVPVKMTFLKPETTTVIMTMELIKYENKMLDESLFKIPEGYTKSALQFDPENMKTMTDEERKAMIKKMMEGYMPKE